ncbi:hypothetical protein BCR42DRAFT_495648 [Absidia repens]|uniref:Heterokaryon incompatibility domain-containing protein n=1 Tax=Absidia repens TaxID=90262 RepID=A0A1X2I2V0_9FUNG|nr:hypothetical protein BCR42DRAFT_495648 [Absidia repens]
MTKDDPAVHLVEDTVSSDTRMQRPFHIVLIDIKKVVEEGEIHCVEKSLDAVDLRFVALEYGDGNGDIDETTVDTDLGYVASVTAFGLDDFYTLCKMMTRECDLKFINYVWVDTICVDQTNYQRRKMTIYRMNDIYEKASFIVVVPDLHLSCLLESDKKAGEIIRHTMANSQYIYHLILENTDQLIKLDEEWLDSMDVPKDPAFRQPLIKYTNQFMDVLLNHKSHGPGSTTIDSEKTSVDDAHDCIKEKQLHKGSISSNEFSLEDLTIKQSNKENESVLYDWRRRVAEEVKNEKWKQLISERSERIRQSMEFFEDLFKRWSSDVWAISLYHIAKKKNNLKYCFIQLQRQCELGEIVFFRFDFDEQAISRQQNNCIFTNQSLHHALTTKSYNSYLKFQNMMRLQLTQQTFLELMLKSKAVKNEDRFYAMLPLSKYKDLIYISFEWCIDNLLSVKLRLFEFMDTQDKLDLLFLSCKPSSKIMVLPTFATSRIKWPSRHYRSAMETDIFPCNFDLTDRSAIMLTESKLLSIDGNSSTYHVLKLKPCEYYICDEPIFARRILEKNSKLRNRLEINDAKDHFDMVCIPSSIDLDIDFYRHGQADDFRFRQVFLVGCFAKNKWIMTAPLVFGSTDALPSWACHYTNDDDAPFDIY